MARYIDVEALKNDGHLCWHDGKGNTFYEVDHAPTADVVEMRHGEYVYSSTDDKWHCSECFAERPRNNGDIPYSDIYCCYKCGARMDGGKDENV